MARLKIFNEEAQLLNSSTKFEEIQKYLKEIDIEIQRLDSSNYDAQELQDQYHFKAHDLMNIDKSFAQKENFQSSREKFLKEHTHADDEVRYFISGSGLFTIHKAQKVFSILCEAGDFINVPAHTKHWFDMGMEPEFKCLRFFNDEAGWIPEYVENSISHRFETYDEFTNLNKA